MAVSENQKRLTPKGSVKALIPYFDGISSATHSSTSTRLEYLNRTIDSIQALGWEVIVGNIDRPFIGDFETVTIDCDPIFLPAELLKYAQEHVSADYFYVSEADQVVTFNKDFLRNIQKSNYLVPHRLEETPKLVLGGFFHDSRNFAAMNGLPTGGFAPYRAKTEREGFAGAFLCSEYLFRKVDFTFSEDLPVEHSTGLDIFAAGKCFKTGDVRDFWVDHLSGRDFQFKFAGNQKAAIEATARGGITH